MNRPPDDDFYSSSTENTKFPPQQRPGQAPGYPQQPTPANYAPQQNNPPFQAPAGFPPQGPMSQPGMGPGAQGFPPQSAKPPDLYSTEFAGLPGLGGPNASQRPANRPDVGPANYAQAMGQPGPIQQNFPPQGPNAIQQPTPGYPPPSGPISHPGFSTRAPQQDRMAAQPPPWPGGSSHNGPTAPPWEQQRSAAPFPAQQQANWPDLPPPLPPTKPRRSRPGLVITLIAIAILVLGSGTIVLFSHKGGSPTSPTAQNTSTTSRVTPVATRPGKTPTVATLGSIGTPVQAGTDWIVTLTSAKTTTSSLIAPGTGDTYLEISMTLKNISSQSQTLISITEFNLYDVNKHHYNETATDTNVRRPPDGTVSARQTLDAQIAYEVPVTQRTFTLIFSYGPNGQSVSWEFTV